MDVCPIDYIVPISPGWDKRPWGGKRVVVRTGSTPEGFREMCVKAREVVDQNITQLGEKMLVIGAWNEWGEGSYIEPTVAWKFQYLDVLRDVFCEDSDHVDVYPELNGAYEFDLTSKEHRFEFDVVGDFEGWEDIRGISGIHIANSCLRGQLRAERAMIVGPAVRLDDSAQIQIRMSVDSAIGYCRLYWATDNEVYSTFNDYDSVGIPVQAGGFHTYVVNLSDHIDDCRKLKKFKIEFMLGKGSSFQIDYIRIL